MYSSRTGRIVERLRRALMPNDRGSGPAWEALGWEPPFSWPVNSSMRTLVRRRYPGLPVKQGEAAREILAYETLVSTESSPHLSHEWLDKMDWPLRFSNATADWSNPEEPEGNSARTRWLEANDVHTEFLDAGIGCCWFAGKGDEEPVTGSTEHEAIARLARKNGWELWVEGRAG